MSISALQGKESELYDPADFIALNAQESVLHGVRLQGLTLTQNIHE